MLTRFFNRSNSDSESQRLLQAEEGYHYHAPDTNAVNASLTMLDQIDCDNFSLTESERSLLKSILNEIEENLANQPKLTLKDWQALANIALPQNRQKTPPSPLSKLAFVSSNFLKGSSLFCAPIGITYAIASNLFNLRFPFKAILPANLIAGVMGGSLVSGWSIKNAKAKMDETLAKIQVNRTASQLYFAFIADRHHDLKRKLQQYEELPETTKEQIENDSNIFAFSPTYHQDAHENNDNDQENKHKLIQNHQTLITKILAIKNARYQPPVRPERSDPKSYMPLFIKFLTSVGSTVSLWNMINTTRDSHDQSSQWWPPTISLSIITGLASLIVLLNVGEYSYEKEAQQETKTLSLEIKKYTKFDRIYKETINALIYIEGILQQAKEISKQNERCTSHDQTVPSRISRSLRTT